MAWSSADIPDLNGLTYVVTGANTGLGFQTAKALAAHGGHVIMACRDTSKGQAARDKIDGDAEVRELDLADLDSVRTFAAGVGEDVSVLINNAGVMIPPLGRTKQGYELQFGTNVLGHFLLTNLLFPRIRDRVVTMSSLMHLAGRLDFDDPNWTKRRYVASQAYGQSKLADLMFAYELQRRLTAAGSPIRSIAAHPGYAATELQTRPGQGLTGWFSATVGNRFRFISQTAEQGALPELYAATAPEAVGGAYIGPDGWFGTQGAPMVANSSRASRNVADAQRLWSLCEELTGQPFDVSRSQPGTDS